MMVHNGASMVIARRSYNFSEKVPKEFIYKSLYHRFKRKCEEGMYEMNKSLSDMTLEELWQLFPIQLTEHQDYWEKWYQEEKQSLEKMFFYSVRINHIGSTAIKGIWAKPIVDILMEADAKRFADIKKKLLGDGYLCMAQCEQRIDFNKGYTPHGFDKKSFSSSLKKIR